MICDLVLKITFHVNTDEVIVIFGATGDLCKRKLIPALHELFQRNLLPENFLIVGSSREIRALNPGLMPRGLPRGFLQMMDYVSTDLDNPESLHHLDYLKEYDTTYFLSVPPERYANAIVNLKHRVLSMIPKGPDWLSKNPLGTIINLLIIYKSVVGRHLREKQVYRIDHYLGKDTANNILATRFSNILLEPLWNRQYIEEVQVFATETIGCEGRAQYYETSGAVRDMLQNHLLQVLALIAMEPPCKNDAKEIRREKTKVLAATRLGNEMILGQYQSYRDEDGVDENSTTPTFVAGNLFIDNWRWEGVPFHFMTGKKMPVSCVEVVIKFKSPPQTLFEGHECNDRIVMRFQPDPHLDMRIDIKSPGLDDRVEPATLQYHYPKDRL